MPVSDTKYNIETTNLHQDLSSISLFHNIKALDSDCQENTGTNNTPYLTSRASYLMNEFSKSRNCITKFNTNNKNFRYKKPIPCVSCISGNTTSHSTIHTQKLIQNQVRTGSSLYTMNIAALTINGDLNGEKPWNDRSDRKQEHGKSYQTNSSIRINNGIDLKHNSYNRYLGKKKGEYLKTENENTNIEAKFGNKTRKFGLLNCNKTC
tara:strand:- start:2825 stop:3448 length:624 start_codon:yes stop_codon:yes gene_type:complete